MDTIFALSSGQPPSAIAVLRISGPCARDALAALMGCAVDALPPERRATLAALRDPASGQMLDRALILWFAGPASATGEDVAEIHAHGGRAVVTAIESALGTMPGLRAAEGGEFTRRALGNRRIDLTEAEGLADLLEAETEGQRQQALALAGGALSKQVGRWQAQLLRLGAMVEAQLDFADEGDVDADLAIIDNINKEIGELVAEWQRWLARPHVERLRDGVRVAIGGPPNAGKSTLLNALVERDAAITSAIAGTTRDIVEVSVAIDGVPFRLADTAGLHGGTGDVIEAEGMARAQAWIDASDLLLWLGAPDAAPAHPRICRIAAQMDVHGSDPAWLDRAARCDLSLSAHSGAGMADLNRWLVTAARTLLPVPGEVAINARHSAALTAAHAALIGAIGDGGGGGDLLIIAESLRLARVAMDSITGQAGTEAMLDALFGRFCIGK